MKDERKTKRQLIEELARLRQQVAELESIRAENRQVSERLRRGARLNQILLDAFPCEAVLLHPTTFEVIASNRAAIDAGAILGEKCFAAMEQRDDSCPWCLGPKARASSEPQRWERESSGVFWDAYWIPVSDDLCVHYAFDITERKQAEEQRTMLASMVEQSSDSIAVIDLEGVVEYVNQEFLRRNGRGSEEVVGTNWRSFVAASSSLRDVYPEIRETVVEQRQMWRGEIAERVENVEPTWLEVRLFPIKDSDGSVVRSVYLSQDITERKQAEEALLEAEAKYRALAEDSPVGIFISDKEEERFIYVNQCVCEITGFSESELLEMRAPRNILLAPEDRERLQGYVIDLGAGELIPRGIEARGIRKTGEIVWLRFQVQPIVVAGKRALQGIVEDITERRQMEVQLQRYTEQLEQLVQMQVRELDQERAKVVQAGKLAAIGQLATGVAHELNQPLTAILIETDFLKRLARPAEGAGPPQELDRDELYQIADDLAGDVHRCSTIINHLREFSRVSHRVPERISLNQPIEDILILVGQRLRENGIEIQLQLDPELPPILADVNKMEQVLLNLITNAEYGVEEMTSRVARGEIECPDYAKVLHISTRIEGEHVVAQVRDNGIGIPHKDQERLFEPFFTTRPVGEGTGLGLSVSYGIVTEFGGEITFESVENEGTTFTLRFPRAE